MAEYLFEEIAARLMDGVSDGTLSPGERLPAERLMAEQYGVSRNVIREAIRVLGEKGFVQVQAGRGTFICRPGGEKLTENLSAVVKTSSASPEEIVDAREVFETALASQAVKTVTEEDLELLHRLCREMDLARRDGPRFAKLDRNFHLAVAACAHNSILTLLAGSVYQLAEDTLFYLTPYSGDRMESAQQEHLQIIRALESRDAAGIRRAIHRHTQCIREQLAWGSGGADSAENL